MGEAERGGRVEEGSPKAGLGGSRSQEVTCLLVTQPHSRLLWAAQMCACYLTSIIPLPCGELQLLPRLS